MRQDEYRHYKATEKRLYMYRTEQARREVLLIERKSIIDNITPSVGVVNYGEHIGRASETLTEPERYAERGLRNGNRLWEINRELDLIEARTHILNFALAVLERDERDIVKAKYFDGLTIEMVADICRYGLTTVKRIRYEAIRKIGAVLFGE